MTDIYVPQRVGEGYFTDWQAPVAGDDLVAWAWDNAAQKYVPQVAPKITSFANAAHTHQDAAGGGQLDHGLALSAASLLDDDHTGYLLATGTRTGASSQVQTFVNGITAAALTTLTVAQTDGAQFSSALKTTYNSTRTSNTSNIYVAGDFAINGTPAAFSEGTLWGIRSLAVAQSTGVAAIAEMDGLIAVARTAPTSTMPVTDMIGVQFSASHQGAGLVTNAYGAYGSIVTVAGTVGNITSARAINAFIQHASTTATITNAYDLFLNVPGSTGTITNMYGARVENMGRAGITNAYGLYLANQSGASTLNYAIFTNAGKVRFGDNVGIGNDPTAAMDIAASTTARASLRVRTGVAPTSPNDGDWWYDGTGFYLRSAGSYSVGPVVRTTAIQPLADSTTAVRFFKADGVTVDATFDTANGRLGIGATPTRKLFVSMGSTTGTIGAIGTTTTFTNPAAGTYIDNIYTTNITLTGNAAGAQDFYALQATMATAADANTYTSAQARALQFLFTHSGSQTFQNAYGMYAEARNLSSGALTNFRGLYTFVRSTGTGAITNVYGAYVDTPVTSGGGTITNLYGFYVNTQDKASTAQYGVFVNNITGATSNFAIVTNTGLVVFNEGGDANTDVRIEGDTDANLFFTDASAESIGVGTNAPTAFLDLKASTAAAASLRLRTGVAPTSPNDGDGWYDGTSFYLRSTGSYSVGPVVRTTAIQPLADSTTSVRFFKADGATVIGTWDTTNGRFGINTTPSHPLHVIYTNTDNAVTRTGQLTLLTVYQNASANFNNIGFSSSVNTGSASGVTNTSQQAAYFGGVEIAATHAGTLTNVYVISAWNTIRSGAAGSVGDFRIFSATLTNSGANTVAITTLRNVVASTPALGGGTIGDAYGMYIFQQKTTGVTTGWGIYQADTADKNYFAGNTGVGSGITSPTALIHLAASTTARASLRVVAGAAPTSPNDGDIWYATRLTFRRGSTTEIIPTAPTQAAYTQTFSTAARTVNAYTSDAESSPYTGIDNAQGGTPYAQLTDLNALRTAYETLRASYDNVMQVVNALIDDSQAFAIAG